MNRQNLMLIGREKLANCDKLLEEKEKIEKERNYWKNEHFQLSLQYEKLNKENKRLIKENNSLKEIIFKLNKGNNEKR